MVKIKKCQSRKHKFGGCGDPRCPEGLSIQQALNTALQNGDINESINIRNKTDIKVQGLYQRDGYGQLLIQDPQNTDYVIPIKVPLHRPEIKQQLQQIDKTIIPSFNNLQELEQHIRTLYHPYAHLHTTTHQDNYGSNPPRFQHISVSNMRVDPDLRSLGIGQHMRSILLKYADEHNLIITGTPTNAGNGQYDEPNKTDTEKWNQWRDKALHHRQRLEHFYLRNGYQRNWCWRPYSHNDLTDYLTGQPIPLENPDWENQFNPDAQRYLAQQAGMYIRFPNGQIPEEFKANTKTKTTTAT